MRWFASFVLKHRLLIIISFILGTAGLGYFIKDIKVENDIVAFLNPDDPEVKEFNRIGDVYGTNYLAITIIKSKNSFSYKTLATVKQIADKIKNLDGILDVTSIVNVLDIKKVDDGVEVGDLIQDDIPKDKSELAKLRDYVLSKDMYKGKIVSRDGKYLTVIAKVDPNKDKQAIAHNIRVMLRNFAKKNNLQDMQFYYSGYPMIMDFMKESILHDVKTLVPIVFVLILLTLFLSFSSFRGVVLPLSAVVIGVVSAVGLMALFNVPMTIVSVLMPVVLVGCGTAYGIHILNKYNEDMEAPSPESYSKLIKGVGIAVLMAGITTVIGFLSLTTATLSLIRNFGLFSAIGMLIALIASFTFVLALLSYMPLRKKRFSHNKRHISLEFVTRTLSGFVIKHPKFIIFSTIVLLIVSVLVYPRLKTEVNFIKYFKEGSSPRIAERIMQTQFGGSLPLSIVIKGDMKSPVLLKEMSYFSFDEKLLPHNNDPMSIADLIKQMNYALNDRYTIPSTKDQVENLWVFLDGKSMLDQLVNKQYNEGLITSTVDEQDTGTMHEVNILANGLLNKKYNKGFSVFDLNKIKLSDAEQRELDIFNSLQIADNFVKQLKYKEERALIDKIELEPIRKKVVLGISKGLNKRAVFPANELNKYLDSDETDIILPKKLRKPIVDNLQMYFKDFTYRDLSLFSVSDDLINKIDNLIKVNTSKSYYLENKDYIADFVRTLVANIKKDALDNYINNLYASLNIHFGEDLEKELKGLLAESTDTLLVLSKSRFEESNMDKELFQKIGINNPKGVFKELSQKYAKLHVPHFSVSGLPVVLDNMNRNLKRSQYSSFLIAFLSVMILLMMVFKSFKQGLIYSLPIAVAVILNFGFMCITGIPLDNATMMIASIAIGIGVDYAIHFASRLKIESHTVSYQEALIKTMDTTGKAIIINTLTVMLGFLVLLFSDTTPMRNFGWLTSLTMLYSALGAMMFVPAIKILSNKKH